MHDSNPVHNRIERPKIYPRHILFGGIILLFAAIGVMLLARSSAATNTVAAEAENGSKAGNIGAGDANGASGGASVRFGGGTSGSGPGTQPAISRDGVKLMRAGKQWKFAGMNADGWGLNDCRALPQYDEPANMTDANIDKYFRELNPHSVTRIWPYKGQASIAMMDRIVTAAEKHGQYLAPAFFDGNDGGAQCGSQRYGNLQANLALIEPIIKRYAKDTGTRKTNSIAFWEISNEIGINDNLAWFNGVARAMKQWDPKTLVGTGLSAYSPGNTTDTMTNGHRSDDIDLISIHEYDGGCGVSHQANKAIGAAKNLNKPWYSGESGGASSPDCLKQEWLAYINAPESAGMLYWDFKMTAGNGMTFLPQSTPWWEAAKSVRHPFQGL